MSTSGSVRTSASHGSAPRKSRQEVGVFREASPSAFSVKPAKKAMPGGGPSAASVLIGARSVADSCACRMVPRQVNPFLSSGHGQTGRAW